MKKFSVSKGLWCASLFLAVCILASCRSGIDFLPGNASGSSQILISFKLDKRLLGPTYGGDRWVSPPSYGPILAPGDTYIVEARAVAVDKDGEQLPADFEWVPEDPQIVTVSPSQGDAVSIEIRGVGESRLEISSQGTSKTLTIKASYRQKDVLEVEITQ